jgi:hypothetical protein
MPQSTERLPTIPTAAALEAEARRLGFLPGFPPSLGRQARHADLSAYRRTRCPACASRMTPRPFHRPGGADGYKLILECRACGAGEAA